MSFLISTAYAAPAAAAAGQQQNPIMGTLVMLAIFAVFIWLFMWRPQTKRAKEQRNLISSLKVGDEVISNGGIAGKISKVEEHFLLLKVAENTEIRMQKIAVMTILPKGTLKI